MILTDQKKDHTVHRVETEIYIGAEEWAPKIYQINLLANNEYEITWESSELWKSSENSLLAPYRFTSMTAVKRWFDKRTTQLGLGSLRNIRWTEAT